jgi:hypothetical protein
LQDSLASCRVERVVVEVERHGITKANIDCNARRLGAAARFGEHLCACLDAYDASSVSLLCERDEHVGKPTSHIEDRVGSA